ncbi:hypothetical protein [Ectopseudomonas khazarica]|uniref:hypothetical protein n=1 Tax=Ectopseudomonas khazarica TaxID=2502979 RepID=UPI00313450FB
MVWNDAAAMRGRITASDLDDALDALKQLEPKLANAALADALNHTLNQAEPLVRAEMRDVFDRPTPFTLNSIRKINARPNNLEAALWIKDDKDGAATGKQFAPEDWVAPQVFGGGRQQRASETWLRQAGILPAGLFAVPGAGARLDKYGNMQRGHMMQILSGLKALNRSGSDHSATASRRSLRKGHALAFFVMKRGRTPIGIAERRGKSVSMVIAFVRQPQYRERLDFHGVVRRVAENDAQLEANIDKAIADALSGRLPTNFSRRPGVRRAG